MSDKISEIPKEQRPYEKCLRDGEGVLTDGELLAVILRCGTRQMSSVSLAGEILKAAEGYGFPGLPGLLHLSVQELQSIPGIGKVKALQLRCVGELARRISSASARPALAYNDPESIARYYMERLRHEEQEHLFCMMMDSKGSLLGEKLLSRGTVSGTLITPREVYVEALKLRAVRIVLIHNHPSGDPLPSSPDMEFTARILAAGEMVGIELADHIIIGDKTYFSFREQGLMKENAV